VCGSAAFLALIAVCFVIAHRLAASGQRRAAVCSRIVGALCAVGVVTAGAPHGSLTLFAGVSLALLWVATATTRLIQQAWLRPAGLWPRRALPVSWRQAGR
jgi:hypothetical protein